MYIFILKKDLSNNDTSSILINKNGGRVYTHGDIDNLLEIDDENTINFDKIANNCYVNKN